MEQTIGKTQEEHNVDYEDPQDLDPTKPGSDDSASKADSETALALDPASKKPPPVEEEEDAPSRRVIIFGVCLYGVCSSTLLLINAVAVRMVHDSSFVLFCQFIASSLTCRLFRATGVRDDIDLLDFTMARRFFPAVGIFFLALLSCAEALKSVNAETVIVARSCAPIAVSALERVTLGRPMPNIQGILCLLAIVMGTVIYVLTDKGFHIVGYSWLIAYYVIIVIDMVLVKFVVDSVTMTTWTRVYYNNTISIPLVLMASGMMGFGKFLHAYWGPGAVAVVLLSCVVGVIFSWAGFNLRKLLSATSFTVVGIVCKILTVLINDVMWENHSNAYGHLGLLLCIASGFMYERTKSVKK